MRDHTSIKLDCARGRPRGQALSHNGHRRSIMTQSISNRAEQRRLAPYRRRIQARARVRTSRQSVEPCIIDLVSTIPFHRLGLRNASEIRSMHTFWKPVSAMKCYFVGQRLQEISYFLGEGRE